MYKGEFLVTDQSQVLNEGYASSGLQCAKAHAFWRTAGSLPGIAQASSWPPGLVPASRRGSQLRSVCSSVVLREALLLTSEYHAVI